MAFASDDERSGQATTRHTLVNFLPTALPTPHRRKVASPVYAGASRSSSACASSTAATAAPRPARPQTTASPNALGTNRPRTAQRDQQQIGDLVAAGSARTPPAGAEVALLFACPTNGLLLQEYQALESAVVQEEEISGVCRNADAGCVLLGLAVPHLLLFRRAAAAAAGGSVTRVPIQGFAGLQVRTLLGYCGATGALPGLMWCQLAAGINTAAERC
jgi:hypothetical protein